MSVADHREMHRLERDRDAGDFCNAEGARRLKQRIEKYWGERGFTVYVELVGVGFVPAMRSRRTDVRSDMVNGFPAQKGQTV